MKKILKAIMDSAAPDWDLSDVFRQARAVLMIIGLIWWVVSWKMQGGGS